MTPVLPRRLLALAFALAAAAAHAQTAPAPRAPAAPPPPPNPKSACLSSIQAQPKDGEQREKARSDAKMDGMSGACRLADGKQFTATRMTEEGRELKPWEKEEEEQELRKYNEERGGTHTLKLLKRVETVDVTESETRRKVAEVPWALYAVDEFGFVEKRSAEFGGVEGLRFGGVSGASAGAAKGVSDTAEAKKAGGNMAAVPEPQSYALLLGGLAAISLIFLRRARGTAQPAARR